MTKISTILIASFAAMLSFSSCQKTPIKETASTEGIKINIRVAGIGGSPETRAAKTSWVAGDKLNLWFDDWNYNEKKENHTPDLILTYDGSSWKGGALAEGRSLKSNGKFLVVYEGYNDLSKYKYSWYLNSEWFSPPFFYDAYDYKICSQNPLTLFKREVPYSFSDNILTASINDWRFNTRFKVLIKNDDGNMTGAANDYILQIHNITKNTYADCYGAFIIKPGETCPVFAVGSSNYFGMVVGVQEPDGIAFYYSYLSADSSDNIKFTLQKGRTKRSYTVTGKTVVCSSKKIINRAVNYSSFTTE